MEMQQVLSILQSPISSPILARRSLLKPTTWGGDTSRPSRGPESVQILAIACASAR